MSQHARSGFTQHAQGIRYAEGGSRAVSVLALLAAALSLAALLAMVATTSWRPLSVALIWPALAVLAFLSFGLLMAAIACAPLQRLDFDSATRTVRGRARRRLGWTRPVVLAFDRLQPPRMQAYERGSQAPVHQVSIGLQGQPPLLLGGFDEAAEAQLWSDRLTALLAAPTPQT